jgi:alpha-beta hydrolase superfamily lysophospholipase
MTAKRSVPRRVLIGAIVHGLRVIGYGVVGAVLMLIVVVVIALERRPDLHVWHTAELDEEYTEGAVADFEAYRALETRLFAQLDAEVYAETPAGDDHDLSRYHRGSLADPGRWPTDWNRSVEMPAPEAKVGVLLIHGMSDAPYSMRSLAERLHAAGAAVVAMRVPGHGTAPSGLVDVTWKDMAGAVALAARHLRDQAAERPLYIVGYSNGGALAVEHALASLTDDTLAPVDGLVLLSPEIGITKLAAFAVWQERLGHLIGLEKLQWNSILPEYDPFKYGSFALNAGKQAYELTNDIQKRLTRLGSTGALDGFPPVLAFQSVVDATVSPTALVAGLLGRLPANDHELVVFDVNRVAGIEHLLTNDPKPALDRMLGDPTLPFALTVLTTAGPRDRAAVLRQRPAGTTDATTTPLGVDWPRDVYSLSHVALPFAPDDPVYGDGRGADSPGVRLGNLVLRGERGALRISGNDMLRLRWNPFHEYVVTRTLEFVGLAE